MSERTPGQVYRAYIDAESRRDDEAVRAILAPDIDVEIDGTPALASADEDIVALEALFAAYPDYRREIIEIIEDGTRAAARWRMVGHPLPALADKLPVLDLRGVSIVAVRDGRISEAYVWSPGGSLEHVIELLAGMSAQLASPDP